MFKKINVIMILPLFMQISCAANEVNIEDFPNLRTTSTYSYSIGKSVMHSDYSIIFDSFLNSNGNTSCIIPVYKDKIEKKYCIASVIDYTSNKMKTYFYGVDFSGIDISKFSDKKVKVSYSSISSIRNHTYIFDETPILNLSGKVMYRTKCSLSIDDVSDPEFPILDIESTVCKK